MMYKTFYLQTDKQTLSKGDILFKGISFYVKNWVIVVTFLMILLFFLKVSNIANTEYFKYNLDEKLGFQHHLLHFFFITVVLYPMIEELTFRLGTNLKKMNVIISLSFLLLVFIDRYAGYNYFEALQYKLPVCIAFALLLYCIPQKYFQIETTWKKGFAVYAITILFALMHITNYPFHLPYLPIYCLLVLPQFIMGVTFVYFRLNLGFMYGYGFHVFINLIAFGLTLLKFIPQ